MIESIAIEPGRQKLKHKHHIIPKHMGGSDDPDNMIELTVEEHAEAHRILYEKHNHWQDYIAWQGLSGRITSEEVARKAASEAMKNRIRTKEEFEKGWNTRRARGKDTLSDSTKKKIGAALKGKKKPIRSSEHSKKLSKSIQALYDTGELHGNFPNHLGTKWWTNGHINKRSKKCPGEGWYTGRSKIVYKDQ